MPSDVQGRVRQLLDEHRGAKFAINCLGLIHSLIILAILAVFGLLASLILSGGEARYPADSVSDLPDWVGNANSGDDRPVIHFSNSGLLPVVTGNLKSANPVHRLAARAVSGLTRYVPPLRNNLGALATLLADLLLLLLILTLVDQYRLGLIAELASEAASTLRHRIHGHMYRLGQSSLPTEGTGPVISLITREVNDVRDGLFHELDRRWRTPVLVAGLIVFALSVSPTLTMFLGSLSLLTWYVARSAYRAASESADLAVRDAAITLAMLHEDLGQIRTVRVYGMEKADEERFEGHLLRYRQAEVVRFRSDPRLNPATWLIYGVATGLALGVLGYGILKSRQITPAGAILLVSLLGALVPPFLGWLRMRKALVQSSRSAKGIFEFLGREPELHQQGGALLLEPLQERIRFKNVSLKNRSGDLLLSGINVDIPAGSKTAIMSLDENSKHAMVCLIPRLIDPTSGSVSIDGRDLREVTLESIRAQVSTVLQADLCFTDTVAMNIGLGDPSHGMPRIIEAAKIAHAHNFIQDLPEGYETVIGPIGHYLRLDEQYRIALARAYLHDPSIVIIEEPDLILDENTKDLIDDSIARLSRNRTVIILPHRLSTIRSCNQIILLHHGKVDTIGPPRELEAGSKLFRHMQYLEFNPFATSDAEAS